MASEAEKKFWMTFELVEKLVSFLDTGSILNLAKCHQLTIDVLNSGTSVWKKLIQRTCPEGEGQDCLHLGYIRPPRAKSDRMLMTEGGLFVQERAEMSKLIAIAKMLEDPETRLFAILDLICQRFPSYVDQHRPGLLGLGLVGEVYPAQLVQVTDFRKQSCSVSLLGFWLLQELEETFGGGLEVIKIEGIVIDQLEEPWLTWLNMNMFDTMLSVRTWRIWSSSAASSSSTRI